MLENLTDRLSRVVKTMRGQARLTEANTAEMLREIRLALLEADVALPVVKSLLEQIKFKALGEEVVGSLSPGQALVGVVQRELAQVMMGNTNQSGELNLATQPPAVILMAGLQGAGKTTSIGKLAKHFQNQGKSVLLAAGDTFRATAREQLMEWGARNNVTVISQLSGDAAAVIFDAIQSAQARGIDVVLADTAGRLTTQAHLMEEIKKVKRVIAKVLPDAPHEVLLVLDANTGQNALSQVKAFDEALKVTGLVLTKLDGTAKGGVIAAIAKAHPIPVRFIGVGEGLDDLRPFVAKDFVSALLGSDLTDIGQ